MYDEVFKLKKLFELRNAVLMSVLVGSYVLSYGTTAFAEEMKTFNLDEMIVTATATPVDKVKTAASVYVITSKEIEDKQYQNLYEALQSVPGMNSRLYGNGVGYELSGYSVPSLRDKYAVVLIDGVNQAMDSKARNSLIDINPRDIDRIEVLKGSASVLYGSNAIGGVINVITKRAESGVQSAIKYSVGNFGYQSYNISNRGSEGDVYWSVNLERRNAGDYEDGSGVNHPTDKKNNIANVKFGYKANDKMDFIVKYDSSHQDMKWSELYKKSGVVANHDGEFNIDNITLISDFVDKKNGEGNNFYVFKGNMKAVRNYHHNPDKELDDGSYTFKDSGETYKVKAFRIADRYYKQINDEHRILIGAEHYDYKDVYLEGKNKIKENSVFIQDEWNFAKNFKLTSGVRYVVPGDFAGKYITSFNLGYNPADNLGLYIARNEYYVQPSMGQVLGTYLYNPNPDIKPTSGNTLELGVNYQIDDTSFLNANIYRREEDNSISWVKEGTKRKYVNVDGTAQNNGLELAYEKQFDENWKTKLSYFRTWSNKSGKQSFLPKDIVSINIDYSKGKTDVGLFGLGKYNLYGKSQLYYDSLPTDSFWVVNAYANYKPTKDIKIFARINNLFDKDYSNVGNWFALKDGSIDAINYSDEGRNFMVGVEYSF